MSKSNVMLRNQEMFATDDIYGGGGKQQEMLVGDGGDEDMTVLDGGGEGKGTGERERGRKF